MLYEELYCARGEMEKRIKERQGDLFAEPHVGGDLRAKPSQLWFSSMAYVLICAMRRIGLAHTQFAATCATIRLKLLKLGALVTIRARRVKIAFASACPSADEAPRPRPRLAGPMRAGRDTPLSRHHPEAHRRPKPIPESPARIRAQGSRTAGLNNSLPIASAPAHG